MAVTGPVGAYTQLPETNPIKEVSVSFTKSYEELNGAGSANGFAAYSFDAAQVFTKIASLALTRAKPGTQKFRDALRDAIREIHEIVGTQGIYNFTEMSPYGVDERSVILVRVEKGAWTITNQH